VQCNGPRMSPVWKAIEESFVLPTREEVETVMSTCREADCCDCRVSSEIGPRASPVLKAIESLVYLPRGGRGCDLR